jgi:predicted transcriptional regulator
MDDLTTYVFLASSFFFLAVALGLLARYRQVSQRINASTDLGHDLWQSLEQRLKKQDERILDMMGRLEVVQSRMLAATATQVSSPPNIGPPPTPSTLKQPPTEGGRDAVTVQTTILQQPESQGSQPSQAPTESAKSERKPDETQLAAMKLLVENSMNTRQLTDSLKKSREHVARVMKELFEMGLVSRNDATKPFVYQLTDEGRRFMSTPA